tara:strand:+ start:344 stop:496 length:153 start_codon:yes stop_codon:yes gene_type:complete
VAVKRQATLHISTTGSRGKKTSQGNTRNIGMSTMNKHKRRSFKKYKGQGR